MGYFSNEVILVKYKELINQMTLEEKAILLSGKDFWNSQDIERLNIPSVTLSDGPHGIRSQDDKVDHLGLHAGSPATCFPTSATIANSWDQEMAEKIGKLLGKEAVARGVDILLGPGLNIKRSPLCGRNFEYFSEDPYLSGKMAAAYIRGIQSIGIAACPKHFAVNNQELLRMTIDTVLDERTLREIYLTGFEIAVKEGSPKSLMTSYNRINGIYANENYHLLEEILVDEWRFAGFVVTDWGGSNDHIEGVKAGSHLEMPTTGNNSDLEVIEAVKDGRLSMEILDKRVDQFLDVVFKIKSKSQDLKGEFDKDEHHMKARQAAENSLVLLKNDHNILPLESDTRVAVIGDFAAQSRYQGAGSSMVTPTKLENGVEAIKKSNLKMIGYEQGFERLGKENENLKNAACNLAEKADVVLLYLGLDESIEVEGMDRKNMRINKNQIELLEALNQVNKQIIVILCGGSAVEMKWIDQCSGLIYVCLPGQAGASAIVNVLTGKICPSGKLTESFPVNYEDTPAYNYFPGHEKTVEHRESIYVGYRYYDTANIPVRFPFGFGLSYTGFSYSDLLCSPSKVSFTLKNIGKVAGAEIAQLYIGLKNSEVFRPKKELKGFKKVFLEPGESKTIEIPLDDKAFRFYSVRSKSFEIESGEYEILVGASSTDIRLKGFINVKGTDFVNPYDPEKLADYYSANIKNVDNEVFKILLGHEIPRTKWDTGQPLGRNDSISQLYYADGWIARLVYKIMNKIKTRSERKGKPNLNILYLFNMPFRAIAKMSGGFVDVNMVDDMLEMVNGHFLRGLGHFIVSWSKKRKKIRELDSKLQYEEQEV